MNPWYSFCRGFTAAVFRGFFGLSVSGEEHIPPQGGVLIAANHLSFLDPPLVAVAMTREIHFLARKTLFKSNGFGRLITGLNSIPIDKDRPDMNGLRLVIKRLQEGHAVLIFPESTRTPDGHLQPGQAGVGLVAVKAAVPILPVRISGTFEALPRHRQGLRFHPLRVAFGAPFTLEPSAKGDKEVYQRAADEIMRRIAAI
jgi:1-acyl-sn-glycerol-3-phosphate acyltransferase